MNAYYSLEIGYRLPHRAEGLEEVRAAWQRLCLEPVLEGHYTIDDALEDRIDMVEWSTWREDLQRLSAQYPDASFTLYGCDDHGTWVAYAERGECRCFEAEITYPPNPFVT